MNLLKLRDKKILILGFGREGRDNLKFLRKVFPKKILGVGDRMEFSKLSPASRLLIRKDKKLKLHLGKDYLEAVKDYEVVVKSPGIPPKILKPFIKNQKIVTQTDIFFEYCKGTIIGVTGTKGKSTTAALIYHFLKKGGLKVKLVGNIGRPVLSYLYKNNPQEIYVYELSCHQLQNLKKSPHIAVLLNIYPEHLDYYKNFKDYIKAKANITRFQKKTDFLIYNPRNKIVEKIAKESQARKIAIPSLNKIGARLKGKVNIEDINAAVEVSKLFGVSKEKVKEALREFKPLPHRLELIGTFRNIIFYDDALSTIPQTTIEAVKALGLKKVETIILGGHERNIDYKELAKFILKTGIKNVILFPTTGKKIWKEISRIKTRKKLFHFFTDSMEEAVKWAYVHTSKNKICLLSTASPSFSIFKNYKEKGNLFKKYVKKFSKQSLRQLNQNEKQKKQKTCWNKKQKG